PGPISDGEAVDALDAHSGIEPAHVIVGGSHAAGTSWVVDRVMGLGDVISDLLISLDPGARGELTLDDIGQCGLGSNLARQLDAFDSNTHVVAFLVSKVARIHGRLIAEVIGAKTHGTAGARVRDIRS